VNIPTGHGTVTPSGGSCLANFTVVLTAKPDDGYRVKAWSGTSSVPATGSNTNRVLMDADKTVSVEFEPIVQQTTGVNLVEPTTSEDPNAEVQAINDFLKSTSLCGTGSTLFVPLCIVFAWIMKLSFREER